MRTMTTMVSTFFGLILSGMGALSQEVELIQPVPETPFAVEVKNRLTGDDLGRGNWAFDVLIENPNEKAVYCRNPTFLAFLDTYDNHCARPNFAVYINAFGSDKSFEIRPKTSIKFKEVGYNERIAKDESTGNTLEFCGREVWNMDCGFNCTDDRKYGDEWDQKVVGGGGSIKYQCMKAGKVQALRDTLKCDSAYTPNPVSMECEVQCDGNKFVRDPSSNTCRSRACGNYAHDQTWSDPTTNGSVFYQCQFGSPVYLRTECLNNTDFQLVGNTCTRKARFERFRFGHPTIYTQCAVSSHNIPEQGGLFPYWSSWDICRDMQYFSYGPYMSFAFAGRYKVTFHIQATSAGRGPNVPVMYLDAYSHSASRTFASRLIMSSELSDFHSTGVSRGISRLLGANFSDSQIEVKSQLPTFTGGVGFKAIQLEFEVANPIGDLETRVQVREGFPNLAGIDIEYFPY